MRAARAGVAALLLAAGACDDGSSSGNMTSITVPEGDWKARIDALPERRRDALMLRAVRDAGLSCQHVVGSAYNGLQFEMPSWVARCEDGTDWLVMLGKGGRAYVARREEAPAGAAR